VARMHDHQLDAAACSPPRVEAVALASLNLASA
jgi:hypothetical protein